MNCGIYEIFNKVDGKRYIGSSDKIQRRLSHHKWQLKNGTHINLKLQNAWNKYGSESFIFDIIHECPKDMLLVCEQWMIDQYDIRKDLYNCNPIAATPPSQKGKKFSEEHRQKLSTAHKLRHKLRPQKAPFQKGMIGPNKGRKFSEEHKQKISESMKGKIFSEEHKKRMSDTQKSRPTTVTRLPKEEIVRMYNSGISVCDIAENYNCSSPTIRKLLTNLKVPKILSETPVTDRLKQNKDDIISMFDNGEKIYNIAKIYNCSPPTISKFIRDNHKP